MIDSYCQKHREYFNQEANSNERCPWCYIKDLQKKLNNAETVVFDVCREKGELEATISEVRNLLGQLCPNDFKKKDKEELVEEAFIKLYQANEEWS